MNLSHVASSSPSTVGGRTGDGAPASADGFGVLLAGLLGAQDAVAPESDGDEATGAVDGNAGNEAGIAVGNAGTEAALLAEGEALLAALSAPLSTLPVASAGSAGTAGTAGLGQALVPTGSAAGAVAAAPGLGSGLPLSAGQSAGQPGASLASSLAALSAGAADSSLPGGAVTAGDQSPEGAGLTPASASAAPGAPASSALFVTGEAPGAASAALPASATDPGTPTVALAPASLTGAGGSTTAPSSGSAALSPTGGQVAVPLVEQASALVTRGNGTSRLTLTLQPESLGEVRVVLIARDGALQVQLSASDAATASLALDLPELRRMLEQAGATEARVSIGTGTGDARSDEARSGQPDASADESDSGRWRPDDQPGSPAGSSTPTDPTPGVEPTGPGGLDLTL